MRAPGRAGGTSALANRLESVPDWFVIVPRLRPDGLRQALAAERCVHENDDYNGRQQPPKMQQDPQIPPALALGIVKNWIGHGN